MKLTLYSSVPNAERPNLVSIQHPAFNLATELVCPSRREAALTSVRATVQIAVEKYVVLCEFARPIHRRVLVPAGELNESDSRHVMETFSLLLAR